MPIRGDGFHRTIAVGATAVVIAAMMMLAATPGLAETIEGWGDAALIETNDEMAFLAQVASNDDGDAIAVWIEWDGTRYNIWSNRYVVGAGWGDAQLIETGDGGANHPQVAMDGEGNAIAVWSQFDGTQYSIWSNRYVAEIGWGDAQLIETDDGGAGSQQVAMDENGNAVAVWCQYDGTRGGVWANRYAVGTGWSDAELIEAYDENEYIYGTQVAMDEDGNAIAVWLQDFAILMNMNIWSSRYVVGAGWDDAQLIETNDGWADSPQVAVDEDGNAVAVWFQSDGTEFSIWSNRYVVGVGWDDAQLIETEDGEAHSPQVVMDGDGNAVAVWCQYDGIQHNIWSNRYVFGVGWDDPELIETGDGVAYSPQVATDGSGDAIAVWQQSDGTRMSIWSNRYVVGTGWGDSELIEAEEGNARSPQVAMDAEGNAIAVWEQWDGVDWSIWSNRFNSLVDQYQYRHCNGNSEAVALTL
jgi:hypothetical protein